MSGAGTALEHAPLRQDHRPDLGDGLHPQVDERSSRDVQFGAEADLIVVQGCGPLDRDV